MKNNYVVIGVIVVLAVLGVGYLYRGKLTTMYGSPTSQQTTPTSTDIITTRTDPNKGNYVAAGNGMTIYVFDKDTVGVSNCTGGCASVWPPYMVSASAPTTLPTNVTIITRADGTKQYAWNGRPLYFYQPDKIVGDVLGDGVNGTWHLVKP